VDHEPGRWSRGARGWQQPPSRAERPGPDGAAAAPPQQLHLVSQGYPVRIRRVLVAGALALALAVGGVLAASQGSGSAVPTSEQSGGVSTTVPEGS
jgi:hypothetical protein